MPVPPTIGNGRKDPHRCDRLLPGVQSLPACFDAGESAWMEQPWNEGLLPAPVPQIGLVLPPASGSGEA